MLDEVSGCAGAVAGIVESLTPLEGTKLQDAHICVGGPEDVIVVKTSWLLMVGKVIAVAPSGSMLNDSVLKAPKILDEAMLGWSASAGACVQLPSDFLPGDTVPSSRPSKKAVAKEVDAMGNEVIDEGVGALYVTKKKKTKEEKAAEKAAKAKAKRAANGEDEPEEDEEEKDLVKANKKQIKECKKLAASKRSAGASGEVLTDDELEAAGFMAQ